MNFIDRLKEEMEEMPVEEPQEKVEHLLGIIEQLEEKKRKEAVDAMKDLGDGVAAISEKIYNTMKGKLTPKQITEIIITALDMFNR